MAFDTTNGGSYSNGSVVQTNTDSISTKTLVVCLDLGVEIVKKMIGDSISSYAAAGNLEDIMASALNAEIDL